LAAVAIGVGDVDVFDLDFGGWLASEAGECVFGISAVQLVYEPVVLILAFRYVEDWSK
jgi:hypothetical protein